MKKSNKESVKRGLDFTPKNNSLLGTVTSPVLFEDYQAYHCDCVLYCSNRDLLVGIAKKLNSNFVQSQFLNSGKLCRITVLERHKPILESLGVVMVGSDRLMQSLIKEKRL